MNIVNTFRSSYLWIVLLLTFAFSLFFIHYVQQNPMSGLVSVLVPYFMGMLSIILLNVYQHPIITWWMFAIPIATFLLSYVMVPMFHVMGHGMMHGGSTESTSASMSHHNVRLDVLVEPYRNIPIQVTTVPRFIQFDDARLQMIKINVRNTSDKEIKVRIRDKIEPGALSNFLDYDLPGQEMKLGPKEKQQWLVQLTLQTKFLLTSTMPVYPCFYLILKM